MLIVAGAQAGLPEAVLLIQGDGGGVGLAYLQGEEGQIGRAEPAEHVQQGGGHPVPPGVGGDGDIVNVDASTIYKGYFSDSSRMYCIGNVSAEKRRLVEIAKQSLEIGLQYVQPWRKIGDLGAAIHEFVMQNEYSVVKDIGGHGVGLEFHEDPWVSYVSLKDTGMLMVPGMVFTIEPMINMGKDEIYISEDDGWTVYTEDGLPSAQWEIQVLVTEEGYEILSY